MTPPVGQEGIVEALRSFVQQGKMARDLAEHASRWATSDQQVAYLKKYKEERARMLDRLDAEFQTPAKAPPSLLAKMNGLLVSAVIVIGIAWGLRVMALSMYRQTIEIIHDVKCLAMPVPQITEARYVEGNKVLLRWKPLGNEYGYRIYRCRSDGQLEGLVVNGVVYTAGAVVNIRANGEKETLLAVTAIKRLDDRLESRFSQRWSITLDPRYNTADSIEPLGT